MMLNVISQGYQESAVVVVMRSSLSGYIRIPKGKRVTMEEEEYPCFTQGSENRTDNDNVPPSHLNL